MFSRLLPRLLLAPNLRQAFGVCALIFLLLMPPNNPIRSAELGDSLTVPLVGIVPAPPFAMKDSQGNWEGIAIDLWRHVARDLSLRFELREMAIPDLIAGLEQEKLLAVVTATASADREMEVDFTHPYYSSGLAIAVSAKGIGNRWFEPLGNLVSVGTAKIMSALLGLLFTAAILVWLCERHANPEQFSSRPLRGIADGLWWAAVTLTTVGYGDKAPRTQAGRVIAIIWMFAAVILIALFTAQVTSSLTVTSLKGLVRGPADLPHVRVGTIQASLPQTMLRALYGVSAAGYASFRDGLQALDRGEIDAFVGVEPVLRYEIANIFPGRLTVIDTTFQRVDYVFALPLGTPMRKRVNQSLLSYIETEEWRQLLRQYLGSNM